MLTLTSDKTMEVSIACVICKQPAQVDGPSPPATLGEKGSVSINKASESRGDTIHSRPGQMVHQDCRRKYCNPDQIAKTVKLQEQGHGSAIRTPALRSAERQFTWSTDCFFCGQPAKMGDKRKGYAANAIVKTAKTIEVRDTILAVCHERGDAWADAVQARILHVHDLHAADAVYHQVCSVNFRTKKQVPACAIHESSSKRAKLGRPRDRERTQAFLEVASFLEENDDEQITIQDLIGRMGDNLAGSEYDAYSYKYMQQKLQEHFGDRIVQTEINGKPNVITFRSKASTLLHNFYSHQQSDPDTDKMKLVDTAAKLIREDIKAVETSHTVYPSFDELGPDECINFLPQTLRSLLEGLIKGKGAQTKIASIGQAIMQAARPRVLLAPLQVGLGVQLHHHFASRFLIDSLHHHGFCCSYQEVHQFERSAALSYGTDIPNFISQFVQYVADNVDHNIRTLDGNDTFHGMGMIAAVTPGTKKSNPILRKKVSSRDIAMVGQVPIKYHREESLGMTAVTYGKLHDMKASDPTAHLDLLWKTSIMFGSPRPMWSGMMQLLHRGNHPGRSSVMFLPMIDMNPSDATCVYSTLKYIREHARRHDVTPIITFDQPLWWKAQMIIVTEPVGSDLKDIILRLGGFHAEMSFLGCIGYLMAGSGLQEVLELIYASNAVVHMLSGKAIARAVRAHLIVDAALNAMVLAKTFCVPLPHVTECEDNMETEEVESTLFHNEAPRNADLDGVSVLYKKLMERSMSADQICQSDLMNKVRDALQTEAKALKSSRTAALWLQYMEMVDILRRFIRAERTGDWELHLQSLSEMLPYMAASGHNNYTKSLWVYLQRMSNLQGEHPDVYQHFKEGLHVVRRSDRQWGGLSSDLVIEQVLMRSMKTSGGLTRGRGMTEQQRLTWSLSMPACAEVNKAMQEMTGVSYNTGEQNKDMAKSRQARDWKDTHTVLKYLQERNPFTSDTVLRNIATGVHAHNSVNVDKVKDVGNAILVSMEGKTVAEYSFKRNKQAVTLDTKSAVKIDGIAVQIDPQLLFQRLTIAAKATDNLEDVFKYELCSYPPALFDSSLLLREPQKPVLAKAIWALLTPGTPQTTGEIQYVLDGGALIQRIPWARGATYREICSVYTEYVLKKYGEAVVVFDGYDGKSTKDMTHQRRTKGQPGVTVTFTSDMQLTMKKDLFLANKTNKQQFIKMVGDHLEMKKCEVHHAPGDADLLIVQKAVELATRVNTVLVGDDTDLLILLCYHANLDSHSIFFRPEPKKGTKNPRVWDIKAVKKQLGHEISTHILFLHAVLGCDTTSRLHGIGKGNSLKKFRSSEHFREQAKVFDAQSASTEDVIAAGEQALVSMYNGKPGGKLDILRYKRFCEKVATNTSHVKPQTLPPTSAAAKYHSLRVFFQVQQWKGFGDELLPEEWGWRESDGVLNPVQTDLPPAPDDLLRVIRCNCQSDCSTLRCTCRKHNVKCSLACGNCRGSGCMNSDPLAHEEVDNDDDDDDDNSD